MSALLILLPGGGDGWAHIESDTRYKVAGKHSNGLAHVASAELTSNACRTMVWLTKGEYEEAPQPNKAGKLIMPDRYFSRLRTLRTQVVEDSPHVIAFKLQQKYAPVVLHTPAVVNSLVSLSEGKIRYHKEQWNEKDHSP